jgi:DNA (cytosine-5)-methyltransferase 1
MRILNLYAGIGGNRKLWGDEHEITAVENNPEIAAIYQSFFPKDKVIIADAHQYLLDHFKEFDFIWSSPPCVTHTRINKNFGKIRYADLKLYEEIILLQTWFKGKFCVENVIPYYKPLLPFQQIDRHYYWTNFVIEQKVIRNPLKECNLKAQRKNKRGTYDGDILNMTLSKGIFDLKGFKISTARKDQILRNCVKPETGLHILDMAFRTKQRVLDEAIEVREK